MGLSVFDRAALQDAACPKQQQRENATELRLQELERDVGLLSQTVLSLAHRIEAGADREE